MAVAKPEYKDGQIPYEERLKSSVEEYFDAKYLANAYPFGAEEGIDAIIRQHRLYGELTSLVATHLTSDPTISIKEGLKDSVQVIAAVVPLWSVRERFGFQIDTLLAVTDILEQRFIANSERGE